jgi:hypothetical protein
MFNLFAVRTESERESPMFAKWNLGGKALSVLSWARDVAQSIDPGAALQIALKVLEIQSAHSDKPGAERLEILLAWAREHFEISDGLTIVIGYVNALVELVKAVQVFRK